MEKGLSLVEVEGGTQVLIDGESRGVIFSPIDGYRIGSCQVKVWFSYHVVLRAIRLERL